MPERKPPAIRIEPLRREHDRGAFYCGNELIDDWCRERALTEHERRRVRVFVACDESSGELLGFYSLTIRSLAPKRLLGIGFGARDIPAIYFAMLGVSKRHAKQGIGTALMIDAFRRCLRVAEDVGAYCLWLQAVDEARVKFYENLQFERIEHGKLDMYLPLATIRDAYGED